MNAATVQGRPLLRLACVLCGAYSRAAFIRGAAFIQGNTVYVHTHVAYLTRLLLSQMPTFEVEAMVRGYHAYQDRH